MAYQLIAALLALLSALVVATGTVIRHLVAEETPTVGGKRGAAKSTLTSAKWWGGAGVSAIGYFLQAAALRFASILLVQPLTIMSLFFAMPMSAKVTGRRLRWVDWMWAILLVLGVGVLLVVGRPTNDHAQAHPAAWISSLAVGVVVVAGLVRLSKRSLRKEKALLVGLASGITYGYMSFLTKSVVMGLSRGPWWNILLHSSLYLIIVAAIVATWLQQSAFNAGAIQQSLPAMTVASPLTSSILGIVVFQERFTTPTSLIWVLVVATIVTIIAVIQLSRSEAQDTY